MTRVPEDQLPKTDDEWREQLTPEQFEVARKAGTERAFTGEYWDCHDDGTYVCVCCGAPLFAPSTSSSRAPAGRASSSPPIDERGRRGDRPQPRHGPHRGRGAATAAPTSATSSPTGRARPASATASTARRCASKRTETPDPA